jgi:hypothetical protein
MVRQCRNSRGQEAMLQRQQAAYQPSGLDLRLFDGRPAKNCHQLRGVAPSCALQWGRPLSLPPPLQVFPSQT